MNQSYFYFKVIPLALVIDIYPNMQHKSRLHELPDDNELGSTSKRLRCTTLATTHHVAQRWGECQEYREKKCNFPIVDRRARARSSTVNREWCTGASGRTCMHLTRHQEICLHRSEYSGACEAEVRNEYTPIACGNDALRAYVACRASRPDGHPRSGFIVKGTSSPTR
jgi:hypothetical protein